MIQALVLAAVGQPLVPLQTLASKTIDIDKFDTPLYSQAFTTRPTVDELNENPY